MILPRPYLSHSQYKLWTTSKDRYIRQYFEGERPPTSRSMRYGTRIHKMLEGDTDDPKLKTVPRYSVMEKKILANVAGVPCLAILDTFDPKTASFDDYKTSRTKYWNRVTVHKDTQLLFYACCVRAKYAKEGDQTVRLHHIETQEEVVPEYVAGYRFDCLGIRLTGNVNTYERVITENEMDRFEDKIYAAALEISAEYTKRMNTI